ncbi:transcriptional regulator [Corynebacterium sp. 13CS0277]|uniref:RrF2 family transcriptional regulator n=1 Tax=Corynebacterium sp. 13CS0277 TaxID=2071994 RepID=UPI000D03384E|nr:Rrf2 family transcriptional regulator [Corynebacterium sp. 13CS0277]PRQ11532.1 transcriptional regulator [Corynebacterium sp. 13CS0277]
MHVTRFSDLGLRIIMVCGVGERPRRTIKQLSEDIQAPANHVAKVVARLGEMGLVTNTRGRGGGVVLAEKAYAARLGDVLRELEGVEPLVDCFEPRCPFASMECLLEHKLAQAQEAFFATLDTTTIADLVASVQPAGSAFLGTPRVGGAA